MAAHATDSSTDRLLRLADLFGARHLQTRGTFNSDVLSSGRLAFGLAHFGPRVSWE